MTQRNKRVFLLGLFVLLFVAVSVTAGEEVTNVRSAVVVELKANQSVSIRCLEFDEVIVNPTFGQADITCRVYFGNE